mgnify:CR=1 FL=1
MRHSIAEKRHVYWAKARFCGAVSFFAWALKKRPLMAWTRFFIEMMWWTDVTRHAYVTEVFLCNSYRARNSQSCSMHKLILIKNRRNSVFDRVAIQRVNMLNEQKIDTLKWIKMSFFMHFYIFTIENSIENHWVRFDFFHCFNFKLKAWFLDSLANCFVVKMTKLSQM